MKIGFVSCSKTKLAIEAPARSLYQGSLFRKASAYCKANYGRWYILSAKYGLVKPDQLVAPYDLALSELSPSDRERWAYNVFGEILQDNLVCSGDTVYWHAGVVYRKKLARLLNTYSKQEYPVEGLGQGQQLAWYVERGL